MSKIKTPMGYRLEVIKEQDPKKYKELMKLLNQNKTNMSITKTDGELIDSIVNKLTGLMISGTKIDITKVFDASNFYPIVFLSDKGVKVAHLTNLNLKKEYIKTNVSSIEKKAEKELAEAVANKLKGLMMSGVKLIPTTMYDPDTLKTKIKLHDDKENHIMDLNLEMNLDRIKGKEKKFMWYDSGTGSVIEDQHTSSKSIYHSLSELLKTPLSDSVKKRIKRARIGTSIKVRSLHSRGDLMLKCVSEEEVRKLDRIKDINNELKEMHMLKKELDKLESELTKNKDE
jgi:hypothetical protein